MTTELFNIERHNQLIAEKSHFWCESCLIAKALSDQSPDERYCQSCYDFLFGEADILQEKNSLAFRITSPDWLPQDGRKSNFSPLKTPTPIPNHSQNLSTSKKEKITVDIFQPRTRKRGPKKMELPEKKIREMSKAGIGSKAITGRLRAEYGIHVSYKTIQRLLADKK
jgi:hypothetical protein